MAESRPDQTALRVLGLTNIEYDLIVGLLDRAPSPVELGMFGAMWSEHCGYKNSRPLLKRMPNEAPWVLQGPGENAGAVSLGGGLALVIKVESHNHPSAIEPFQGAATGVGGIMRDIFAMGARPVAILDSLRFGLPSGAPGSHADAEGDARLRHLFHGVVAGIGSYGNCMGVPTVGGETVFEQCYAGNPLVNAMCVGLVAETGIVRTHAGVAGNLLVLIGAATGRDGIHGATFASVELDAESEARRPAVQVGDPLTEKLLLEACLELRDRGLVAGMQDLGAAGLTSSTVEMADKSGSGIDLDLALVPRRAPEMSAYELMLSESQERMLVAIEPAKLAAVKAVLDRWELPHSVVGTIAEHGRMKVHDGPDLVADVPVSYFTDRCPTYVRPGREEERVAALRSKRVEIPDPQDPGTALLQLLRHPNIGSKQAVWQQYDHTVQTNTMLGPGADAAVLRLKGRPDAVALTIDGDGKRCFLEPYSGGALAVFEAARNLACVGARPLCVTDCLNFGSPERPEVYYQLEQAINGIADACSALNVPVISGNVSLYNESGSGPIYPTPIVGMAGQIDDASRICTPGFKQRGDAIVLLGSVDVSLAASAYMASIGNDIWGEPAPTNFQLECAVQALCIDAITASLINSAHDCAGGGLAVTLAECALAEGIGAEIVYAAQGHSTVETLFGEGPSRIVVSVSPASAGALLDLAHARGVPTQHIGTVGGDALAWQGMFDLKLGQLAEAHNSALAALYAPG